MDARRSLAAVTAGLWQLRPPARLPKGRMLRKENRRIWRVLQLRKAEFGGGGGGGVSTEKPEKGSNPSRTSDILMARMKRSFVTRGGAEVESTAKQ